MTTLRVLCEKWRHGRVIAVAVTLLALSMPAVAQQAPSGATKSVPDRAWCRSTARQQPAVAVEAKTGALEALLYRWIAPSAEEQLAADTTVVPAGSGAVFVPAMTNGADEPETLVYQGTQRVASGLNGRRIVLAPGSYVLRIGSSPLNQMMSVPVEVTAGNTRLVPVTWGGMIVEVVDRNNVPHRGTYELINVADRQPYTVGFGADTLLGEKLKTILATPGLYRIVRPGANYRTRIDFSTVVIPYGQMVYFKLVQDPDDGSLLGAGVVPPNEMGIVQPGSAWTRTFTVGVGLPITDSSNVVGTANQTTIGGDFTFDTYMIYDRGKNYAGIIFEVEEGFVSIDPEVSPKLPLQKTVDRLRFDTIYTRLLGAAHRALRALRRADEPLRVECAGHRRHHRGEAPAGRHDEHRVRAGERGLQCRGRLRAGVDQGGSRHQRPPAARPDSVARLARRPRPPAEPVQWRLRARQQRDRLSGATRSRRVSTKPVSRPRSSAPSG